MLIPRAMSVHLAIRARIIFAVGLVAAAALPATARPHPGIDNVATSARMEDYIHSVGLRLNGATHFVAWAVCDGLGRKYEDPFGNNYNRMAYKHFRCRAKTRFSEGGGYNDRTVAIWVHILNDGSFFPHFVFQLAPIRNP
jgi:hypothetical protein